MLTYFFLVAGALFLILGAAGYYKYWNWKKNGRDAVSVYEEILSGEEKKVGPMSQKTSYICKFRTEITSGGRITHGTRMESCENKAEAKRLLGKKLKGLKDASGEFLDTESVDALRKSAMGKLIAGAAGLLIALARVILISALHIPV